ncbi:MAG: DUF4147 domain-containing protein [Campylobacterota bacterium]|nr:DUF4147 domain-containing protein [Campylobacterota bacterium]
MSVREDIRSIFNEALDAIRPANLIHNSCRLEGDTLHILDHCYDLSRYKRIFLFGSGKAAWPMAEAVEALLGDRIENGLIVVPVNIGKLQYTEVLVGSHPIPSHQSLEAAHQLINRLSQCQEEDLFIYLLSGGSSALIEAPITPITLDELQTLTQALLTHHYTIQEINTIRKHISAIKGGRMGALSKAKGIVLVVSDVIGDDLEAIGSGPLYYDTTTFEEAKALLSAKSLFKTLPSSVQSVINQGCNGMIKESPKEPSKYLDHHIIGTNSTALKAAEKKAKQLGYHTRLSSKLLEGDADSIGRELIHHIRNQPDDSESHSLIYGGETTVDVKGDGKGGRNQQLCLSALSQLNSDDTITLLSAGTDGVDGNSDAAGAIIDRQSLENTRKAGLSIDDYLSNNDAYHFFKQTGDLILTGPTGTNVMDITIIIKGG